MRNNVLADCMLNNITRMRGKEGKSDKAETCVNSFYIRIKIEECLSVSMCHQETRKRDDAGGYVPLSIPVYEIQFTKMQQAVDSDTIAGSAHASI